MECILLRLCLCFFYIFIMYEHKPGWMNMKESSVRVVIFVNGLPIYHSSLSSSFLCFHCHFKMSQQSLLLCLLLLPLDNEERK